MTYTYGNSQWGDLLTGYNGKTFTYDAVGNLLSDGEWTYTWKHGRQLESMTKGSSTFSFVYNADGMRIRTDLNGSPYIHYVYDGSTLIQMRLGNHTLDFTYGTNGPVSVTWNGTTYYYVTNIQGDVISIVDANGTAVVNYSYDAWGNVVSNSGSMLLTIGILNPLLYRGYVYDWETKLYYLQSRYYDPAIGRWISPEPNVYNGEFDEGAGLLGYNVYVYCANNPVKFKDNSGEFLVITLSSTVISLVAAAVVTVGTIILFEAHKTLKNGSKKKTNDKHTKPRPGRASEKKKQKDDWKSRK